MGESGRVGGDTGHPHVQKTCILRLLGPISDAVMVLDEDGTVEYANPAAERLFGYRAEVLCGSAIFDYLSREDVEGITGAVERVACVAGAGRLIRGTCPCIDPPRAVPHDTAALDRFVRSGA